MTISNPVREKRDVMVEGSERIFEAERLKCLFNDQVSGIGQRDLDANFDIFR